MKKRQIISVLRRKQKNKTIEFNKMVEQHLLMQKDYFLDETTIRLYKDMFGGFQ